MCLRALAVVWDEAAGDADPVGELGHPEVGRVARAPLSVDNPVPPQHEVVRPRLTGGKAAGGGAVA